MLKRLLLLIGVLAVPVGVALASQALSETTAPPELPDREVDLHLQEEDPAGE